MDLDDTDKAFAAAVKKGREAQGWSQAELADRCIEKGLAFSGTTIYKIEQGKRKVTVAESVKLARALRMSVYEMIPTAQDSSFVTKETLLNDGMEALFSVEKMVDHLHVVLERQRKIRATLANHRRTFGEDPLWLEYIPGHQNLADHWEPLATWSGPRDFVNSWEALNVSTNRRYESDLGWGNNWLDATMAQVDEADEPDAPTDAASGATLQTAPHARVEALGLDQISIEQLERENWHFNGEMPPEVFARFAELALGSQKVDG